MWTSALQTLTVATPMQIVPILTVVFGVSVKVDSLEMDLTVRVSWIGAIDESLFFFRMEVVYYFSSVSVLLVCEYEDKIWDCCALALGN